MTRKSPPSKATISLQGNCSWLPSDQASFQEHLKAPPGDWQPPYKATFAMYVVPWLPTGGFLWI